MTDNYNGWTNRETWATALHIDNDEGLYNYRRELVDNARKEAESTAGDEFPRSAEHILADSVEAWVTEMSEDVYFPEQAPTKGLLGMFHDIGSLWRVNWQEIAKNFMDE